MKSLLTIIFHLNHGHLEGLGVVLKGLLRDLRDYPTFISYQVLLLFWVRAESLVMEVHCSITKFIILYIHNEQDRNLVLPLSGPMSELQSYLFLKRGRRESGEV